MALREWSPSPMRLALLAGALLAIGAAALANDLPPGVTLVDGYIPRFAQKREMIALFGQRHEALRSEILRRGKEGQYLPCSSQILEETDWLIDSTRDEARILRRLDDLEASLKRPPADQAADGDQTTSDGSWGRCYEEWFLRLYASTDTAKELVARRQMPRYPLRFLAEVDTPAKIVERFRRLKVSRVLDDGINHRKELNLTVTGLGQFLFLPELAGVMPASFPRQDVATALIDFMDQEWQESDTGYWGPWYRIGERTLRMQDLSMTFHIASYRAGKVPHLQAMVRTTFDIRERPYPYGWQDRGTQNCHHSYDVVRLVRFGWPHMSDMQKAFAQAQLVIILARTLRLSINPVGEVDMRPYNRVAEAYYFCTSLLDEIGYFRPSRNFWSQIRFDGADDLRRRLLANLEKLPQLDPMVFAARHKLEATD